MGGQETRVTKISKLQDRIPVSTESCLVKIHGPKLGKKYVLDEEEFTIGRDVKNKMCIRDRPSSAMPVRSSCSFGSSPKNMPK